MINIIKFYEVYCDVEPKRKALAQANAELAFAQDKLGVIKRKVVVRKWNSFFFFFFANNYRAISFKYQILGLEPGGATCETNFRF